MSLRGCDVRFGDRPERPVRLLQRQLVGGLRLHRPGVGLARRACGRPPAGSPRGRPCSGRLPLSARSRREYLRRHRTGPARRCRPAPFDGVAGGTADAARPSNRGEELLALPASPAWSTANSRYSSGCLRSILAAEQRPRLGLRVVVVDLPHLEQHFVRQRCLAPPRPPAGRRRAPPAAPGRHFSRRENSATPGLPGRRRRRGRRASARSAAIAASPRVAAGIRRQQLRARASGRRGRPRRGPRRGALRPTGVVKQLRSRPDAAPPPTPHQRPERRPPRGLASDGLSLTAFDGVDRLEAAECLAGSQTVCRLARPGGPSCRPSTETRPTCRRRTSPGRRSAAARRVRPRLDARGGSPARPRSPASAQRLERGETTAASSRRSASRRTASTAAVPSHSPGLPRRGGQGRVVRPPLPLPLRQLVVQRPERTRRPRRRAAGGADSSGRRARRRRRFARRTSRASRTRPLSSPARPSAAAPRRPAPTPPGAAGRSGSAP